MKKTILITAAILGIGVIIVFATNPPPAPAQQQPSQENNTNVNSMANSNTSAKEGARIAKIVTAKGDITLDLYPKVAPKTVDNFIKLARQGFYDGVTFHRVVPGFVIQGGDPLSKDNDPSNDGTGGPGYTFEDEINAKALGLLSEEIKQNADKGYRYRDDLPSLPVNVGALAMANSGPNTNGSQFFIVTDKAQPHLNGLHTVFGEVVSGMDVVHKIMQGDKIQTITIQD